MTDKQIKVRIVDRWRVMHHGKPYIKGDELTVPEDVAQQWIQAGWAAEVKPPPPRKAKSG